MEEMKTSSEDLVQLVEKVKATALQPLGLYNLKRIHLEIIDCLLKGHSNKEIAHRVKLSEQAVKYHLGKLFKAFGVPNRARLRVKIRELVAPQQV